MAEVAAARSTDTTRHKCFVSYHAADADEVESFLDEFGAAFIPRVIGVTDEDPWVESNDTDYIMEKIREKYLTDSTVTIVLRGKCTWARKYVDWEIYSSLRNDSRNKRSGLMGISLPSFTEKPRKLPTRLDDNLADGESYAKWWVIPIV
ncbi:TIR domain-containing protein [Glycomyces halotolerans]